MSARGKSKGAKEKRSPIALRRGLLLGFFMVFGVVILARAGQLQLVEHERWLAAAEEQHRERVELPARRGAIFDRNGVPLAISHEVYQVAIAPREINNRDAVIRALVDGLSLSERDAKRITGSNDSWVVLAGRFDAEQRQKVGNLRGVHFERHFERFYPQGDVGREVIGAVTRDNRALGGIEQQMDELLRGTPGYSILRRAASGKPQPAISLPVVPPTDGASIHLTIDLDLQAIADAALRDAMERTGSVGGDLILADPSSGELLAAVSRRAGRTRSLTAITEPYEPGSTLKPFLAATLLAEHKARLEDAVFAEMGTWTTGSRTFRDTSPHEWLTLREALEVSSNIAMVKFAQRLSPGQQYSYLRDFGFGTATGIEYPAESSGRLRRPTEWSKLSSGSLAIGYEISVTPLQMVSAYGALANGGRLMEPYLVREVRAPDGSVLSRRSPTAIREVVPEDVAKAVTEVLVDVVEQGTATRAALATFDVAGKTGTSRRTGSGNGYSAGAYTSTFAGYFPADDPQIVIFVKLDEPKGDYYGGLTAAPVTRETLQGILAVRNPGLDGRTLLATRTRDESALAPLTTLASNPVPAFEESGSTSVKIVDLSMVQAAEPEVEDDAPATVELPSLEGLTLREAALRAHEAGLRVKVRGSGRVARTQPDAGAAIRRGEVVTLIGGAG